MGKREQKRKKKLKTEKTAKTEDVEIEKERPDYGGLPQRDLKKNLGCG